MDPIDFILFILRAIVLKKGLFCMAGVCTCSSPASCYRLQQHRRALFFSTAIFSRKMLFFCVCHAGDVHCTVDGSLYFVIEKCLRKISVPRGTTSINFSSDVPWMCGMHPLVLKFFAL